MRQIAVLLALLTLVVVTGCNTMEGLGRDIERGGEKMQDSAGDAREKM